MPLPQQDEFGVIVGIAGNTALTEVSMPLPQQDEFGVYREYYVEDRLGLNAASAAR